MPDPAQMGGVFDPTRPIALTNDLTSTGGIVSTGTSTTGGIGYAAGAGGAVTQATSKSTAVTLNRLTGQVTMNNASLAAAAEVSFTVNNTLVGANDVVVVNHSSAGTAGSYLLSIGAVAAGSFSVTVSNASAGSLSEAIVIGFAVIKGANA